MIFFSDFGYFSSPIYPLKMRKESQLDANFPNQVFNGIFKNLRYFGLAHWESIKTDPFFEK